jgi:hypothetical protein
MKLEPKRIARHQGHQRYIATSLRTNQIRRRRVRVTRRTATKLAPIIRILIQITKPTIISRVIRRRERNRRKSTTRSRPPMSNKRPLKIKIKARSQRIKRRTTITIRSSVYPRLTTLMSLIPPPIRPIDG